ncbi:PglL family O-oligosaccharyltransferase [Polaromonas sp. JS666]|uniref:PglL family O-oligosaccharyltransferase n=1 Tax=Polaromonas sp. (strain JS666 / ATCC BAA-500) TaxID=296591 RepID=UPI00005358E4|nr:Wzy polymerase domain-containing protein [Polaromonas sp. JS666]ABE46556.1 O-antigen polymerase [Polaromonas sp. JS666]
MTASRFHAFGVLCLAWAWLAYDHYRPWVNFHSEALALLGIGLLVASRCLVRSCLDAEAAPRIVWWVMAAGLLPWLQYAMGISLFAGDALLASLYLSGLGAAIWLGYSYVVAPPEKDAALTSVFYMLWFAALVSAAIGLLQWLNLQGPLAMYVVQTDAGDRAMGNLGQPNQLATLLLMGMAALAWTFERKRIGRLGLIVGIAFMSVALVLAQSRAGMLSALVGAIFLIWKNNAAPERIAPRYVFAWLLAYGAAVQMLPYFQDFLLMGGGRSMNLGVDSARVTIWKQMLSGIGQSPWLGYGWNQTPTAHAAGSLAVPGSMTYTNAHNIVLDILAWNGVPLGLVLTAACAYWFVSRMHGAMRSSAIYAMACLLPIAVHSMVEYPFAYSYFLLTAGLMVGIVEASHRGIHTIRLNLRWVGCALAVWFVLGSYMVYEYLLIEEDFRVVRFENLRIGQTPAEYKVPDVWVFSHMASMLKAGRQQALPGMKPDDLENLRKASLRFPYGSLGLRYALALGLNGDPAGATRQMAVVRGMYGEYYYQAAVSVLRAVQQEKYPELSKVVTP